MNKYITIHENKNDLEQFYSKKSLAEKMELSTLIDNLTTVIMQLDKYTCTSNSGGQDCWCTMDRDDNGEYIKLEDILTLFQKINS